MRVNLPCVVDVNRGNHESKSSDAEPSAHVPLGVPRERALLEQGPENETQWSYQRLRDKANTKTSLNKNYKCTNYNRQALAQPAALLSQMQQ